MSSGLKLCLSKLKGNGISPFQSCFSAKTHCFLFFPDTIFPNLSQRYPFSLTFHPSLSIRSPFSLVKRMMLPFSSLSNSPMIECSLKSIAFGSGFEIGIFAGSPSYSSSEGYSLITPSFEGEILDFDIHPSSSSSTSRLRFFFPLPLRPFVLHLDSSLSKFSTPLQKPTGPPEVKVWVSPFENDFPFLPRGFGGAESAYTLSGNSHNLFGVFTHSKMSPGNNLLWGLFMNFSALGERGNDLLLYLSSGSSSLS